MFITYTEDIDDLIETFSIEVQLDTDDTQLLAYMRPMKVCSDIEGISNDI